jgi:Flp pilus assembly protein TadG
MSVRVLRTRRRGVAAVEFAVLAPFLVALLVGIWEVGRLVEVHQLVSNAAREGARQGATGQLTNEQVEDVVLNYLSVAGIPTDNVEVDVDNLDDTGADLKEAEQLDRVVVRVSLPASDVLWIPARLAVTSDSNVSSEAVWNSVKDKPYPDPDDPAIE